MVLSDCEIITCQQEDKSWVAEIPGCYALMPSCEEALEELPAVFQMIEDERREREKR